MRWFGGEHFLEELGADIGTFGCWCSGKTDANHFKLESKGADERTVGIKLRHPHNSVQPAAEIRHKHRPPFRSARQRSIQALVRNNLRISSFHAVLGN